MNLIDVHVKFNEIPLFKTYMEKLHFSNFPDCNSEDIQLISVVCMIIEDSLAIEYQIQFMPPLENLRHVSLKDIKVTHRKSQINIADSN